MAAQLEFSDILTRCANSLRLPVSNTVEMAKLANLINEVYRDICAKQDWLWLEEKEVINTKAVLTSGTVSVALGSSTISFTDPATEDITDRAFYVPGNALDSQAVYRIASTGSIAGEYILDGQYTGATSTEASYKLWEDLLLLSDESAKVLRVMRFGHRLPIQLIGKNEMGQWKITDVSEGKPDYATVINAYALPSTESTSSTSGGSTGSTGTIGSTSNDESAIGRRQLQIHPYPDKAYRLEILFKENINTELTSTGDHQRPLIPDEFSQIMVYGTLARGYPIFLADQERGQYYQQLFNDLLSLMAAQNKEYTRDNPAMHPANDYRRYGRRRQGPMTMRGWFDRYPAEW